MAIKVGDKLARDDVLRHDDGRPEPKTTDEVFKGKKVALFAVPGAFTPTCTNMHMPSFVKNTDAIKAKGVNDIVVTSSTTCSSSILAKSTGAEGKVDVLCPTATRSSPRRWAWTSTARAAGSAPAPSAIRCWSRMAW